MTEYLLALPECPLDFATLIGPDEGWDCPDCGVRFSGDGQESFLDDVPVDLVYEHDGVVGEWVEVVMVRPTGMHWIEIPAESKFWDWHESRHSIAAYQKLAGTV